METTSHAATSCSDVGDDHVEMLLDDVSSEVQEMKSADAPVENIATGDTERTTELNDSVRNYYYLHNERFGATGEPRCISCVNIMYIVLCYAFLCRGIKDKWLLK